MRALVALFAVATGCAAPRSPSPSPSIWEPLPRGVVLADVRAAADPSQRYAIYLPAGYSRARRWPLIFGFSPTGRGLDVVERLRAAAERAGWIVLASNNARNGPAAPIAAAQDAMWKDATHFLAVHPLRLYATGFSGGARMALTLALAHPAHFAGVISVGAFLPPDQRMPPIGRLAVYLIVGERDPNLSELHRAAAALDGRGAPHWLDENVGPHVWPDAAVFARAVEFLDELARPDAARRRQFLDGRMAEAARFEGGGDRRLALALYRQVARHAAGTELAPRAAAEVTRLEAAPDHAELEAAAAVLDESSLEDLTAATRALATAERYAGAPGPLARRAAALLEILPALGALRAVELARDHDDRGARGWLSLVETHLRDGAPNAAATHYNRGCAWSLLGDFTRAREALERAIALGLRDRGAYEHDPDLAPFRSSVEHAAILGRLR